MNSSAVLAMAAPTATAIVTLVNPVGLHMDNIDLSGWELPDGIAPAECIAS
jgi:hypothetical protein